MLEKNNEDSSSSEDETAKNELKEATDHEFFKNTSFSAKKNNVSDNSDKPGDQNQVTSKGDLKKLKSLRKDLDNNERFDNFGVSATFQNYVAKKLDEIIEKSVKIKDRKEDSSSETNSESANNSGIKLLSTSADFLSAEEDSEVSQNPQRKRKIEATVDDKGNLLKCKEVAVDSEWILSGTETKAWASKRKEPEFRYKKLKNGTIVETI